MSLIEELEKLLEEMQIASENLANERQAAIALTVHLYQQKLQSILTRHKGKEDKVWPT